MSKPKPVLVFIPTYNEHENVEILCRGLLDLGRRLDILFIDDHSPDGTGKVLDGLAQKHPNVTVIHRSGKLGIGSAHREGIRWAYAHGYQVLITMDSDFTHPPVYVAALLDNAGDHDVVVGSRYVLPGSLEGWELYRKFLSYLGHFLTVIFLLLKYDATGALRLYRLDRIPQQAFDLAHSIGYSFFYESLFILNFNKFTIKEIPIKLPARIQGHSKMCVQDVWQSFQLLVVIFWHTIVDRQRFKIAGKYSPSQKQ